MTLAIDREEAVLIKRLLVAEEKKRRADAPKSDWPSQARPNQLLPDGDWSILLVLAGRAFGKTRSGGENVAHLMQQHPGSLWGVIGPKWTHTRDVPMSSVRESLNRAGWKEQREITAQDHYQYNKSDLTITLPNRSMARGFSAETPDAIRGFNLWGAWCDEIAFFPRLTELWYEALVPAVRVGPRPIIIATTTPKPKPLLKDLTSRDDNSVVIVTGSTWENAENLSPLALDELRRRYEGTRMGRQELYGELIWEAEGALWTSELIEASQWIQPVPPITKTVVSVDPSGSATGDATGILTVALGADRVLYVISDDTCKGSPEERYRQVCLAAQRAGAGIILYENAYGGDNIAHGIRSEWSHLVRTGTVRDDALIPQLKPSPTKSSKADRAHPVVALYEQTAAGMPRIRHIRAFPELEEEMVQWEPASAWSPNRIDALVHGVRFLAQGSMGKTTMTTHIGAAPLPKIPIR